MDDEREHPSSGLVPDMETRAEPLELGFETPDTFDTPMDEDTLENELPEEGVRPKDVAFERDLEEDVTGEPGVGETGVSEGAVEGDGDGTEPYRGDTDFEQDLEDQDIGRYGGET